MDNIVSLSKRAAKLLKAERIRAGLSQKELAEAAGVSFGSYKKFEQTGKGSTELFLSALAVLKGPDVLRLIFDEDETGRRRVSAKRRYYRFPDDLASVRFDPSWFRQKSLWNLEAGQPVEVERLIAVTLKNDASFDTLSDLYWLFGRRRIEQVVGRLEEEGAIGGDYAKKVTETLEMFDRWRDAA